MELQVLLVIKQHKINAIFDSGMFENICTSAMTIFLRAQFLAIIKSESTDLLTIENGCMIFSSYTKSHFVKTI